MIYICMHYTPHSVVFLDVCSTLTTESEDASRVLTEHALCFVSACEAQKLNLIRSNERNENDSCLGKFISIGKFVV